MKKNKVTNLLKFGILLFGISLLLSNCENEDKPIQELEIEQEEPNIKISKIHKEKIQENKAISQKLNTFKEKIKKENTFQKTIYSSEYDFYIETDYATYIENKDGSYHSYTFPILREKDNKLIENLLLSLQPDGSYKMFLTSYQLSEQDLDDIENGIEVDFTNKINSKEISDDNLINNVFAKTYGCVETYYLNCSVGGAANGHGPSLQKNGSYCSGSHFVIDVSGCSSGGISYGDHSISTGTGSNYTGSGNTTNGNGTSYSDSATATAASYNFTSMTNCFGCPTLEKQQFIDFLDNLSIESQSFLNQIGNSSLKKEIETFLNNNLDANKDYTTVAVEFVKAAIDFLEENPEYNFEQYENWFGTENEGLDYEYDAGYWEDPSLTFTPQDLPSWDDFNLAYPRKADGSGWLYGADNIYSLVGGDVLGVRLKYPAKTNNTCALKVSIALNGAGITIPQITTTGGGHGTVKGADGKNYFLNAKSLNAWMKLTFGTSPTNPKHFNYTAAQGGVGGKNFPSLIGNKKGIYSLTSGDPTWATGHADIFFENICAAGCHYNGRGLESIDIWVLD